MPQLVIAGESFAAGLRSEFLNTYRRRFETVEATLGRIMRLNIPSDKETEKYFYWEAAPHIRRWIRGQAMPGKPFKGVQFSVTNFEWATRIEWHYADRQDDQTKSLMERSRDLGRSFSLLAERVAFQLKLSSTDLDLLPSIPNAPDGAALYSTATRFEASGGNVVSGGGVATSDAIRIDFFKAIGRMRDFKDGEGQPLWNSTDLDGPYVIIAGSANEKKFRDAFVQGRTLEGGAALTNIILDSGIQVLLWITPRITDNDWYVFLSQSDIKPLFSQERDGITDNVETFENSDNARRLGIESIQFQARYGFGVALPYATVKIDN